MKTIAKKVSANPKEPRKLGMVIKASRRSQPRAGSEAAEWEASAKIWGPIYEKSFEEDGELTASIGRRLKSSE